MQLCTSTLSVLLLLTTVSESAVPTVKVKLHDSAVLPCSERCSGVVRWTLFSKSSEVLAECDQTSCRSVKEGYQMIYNQYLQGNLSLIITEADFSKRALYTCECDGTDLCDVRLRIQTLNTTVHMKVGETLVLEVNILDKWEVIYNSTDPAKPSIRQFCTVEKRAVKFGSDYEERASLTSDLELRGLKESDSGVYTVRNILTGEVISIYTVFVHGDSGARGQGQKPTDPNSTSSPDCHKAALAGWVVAVVVFVVSVVVMMVLLWKRPQCLQRGPAMNADPQNPQVEAML